MGRIFTLFGELKVISPAGVIDISIAANGIVVVTGSQPRNRVRWYWDQLRGAIDWVRHPKARPREFILQSQHPQEDTTWYLKMLEAAADTVRRYRSDVKVPKLPGNTLYLPAPKQRMSRRVLCQKLCTGASKR